MGRLIVHVDVVADHPIDGSRGQWIAAPRSPWTGMFTGCGPTPIAAADALWIDMAQHGIAIDDMLVGPMRVSMLHRQGV